MKPAFVGHPVFICGHRRSGTTLLLSLLDHHPELMVFPSETGFFYAVYPPYFTAAHSKTARIKQISSFCLQNLTDHINSVAPDARKEMARLPAKVRGEFQRLGTRTSGQPQELLEALMLAYWKHSGQSRMPRRWVEKTTSSEIYAADARRWFPDAKFVHVLRDPRDNWASLKSGWEVRFKFHNDSPDRLMHSLLERGRFGFELADRNVTRFGENSYKVIRYEDLLADTAGVMGSVCDFLDVSRVPEVLTPTVCGRPWQGNNYGDTARFTGPSTVNAGRWRERITPAEAALIEFHYGDLMVRRGYAHDFSVAEQIDAAVDHYKWYNYAQAYSFTATQQVSPTPTSKAPASVTRTVNRSRRRETSR